MSKPRILLVDDETRFRTNLQKMLGAKGLTVNGKGSGAEALEELKWQPYDVMVLDIRMPGMDGLATLAEIKKINPEVEVIILSGHASMDAAMEIFEMTKAFPAEERYSMTDQIRRSSRSVAANIAEAWRKRRYPAAFVSKLNDADSEAAETQTWLEFAFRCRYCSPDRCEALTSDYERICAQLIVMIDNPKDWTVRSGSSSRPRVSASRPNNTQEPQYQVAAPCQ